MLLALLALAVGVAVAVSASGGSDDGSSATTGTVGTTGAGTGSATTGTTSGQAATTDPPAEAQGVRRGDAPESLWLADAEGALAEEWANVDCQEPERVAEVPFAGAQGSRAYRFEIQDGDDPGGFGERCEVAQSNPPKDGFPEFEEGDEPWMSWQVYLPDDYPIDTPDWNVITQWKQRGGLGTPVLSMEVRDGEFLLLRSESPDGDTQSTEMIGHWPARQGRWVRFTFHARFSPEESEGFVELYGDLAGTGMKPLLPRFSTYTMKRDNGEVVPSHVRMGIYRNDVISGTAHLYLDGVNVATTRAAAEAAAFPASTSAAG